MSNEVGDRHKIGIVRAVKGEITIEEQTAQLVEYGVDAMHVWRMGKDDIKDIALTFRSDPGNDLLVVPFLGALGNKFDVFLGMIGDKGADLYDLQTKELIPLRGWEHFTTVKRGVMFTRTAPGRAAAKTGAKPGPKKKLVRDRFKEAREAWSGKKGGNQDIADDFGVSVVYLHRAFGARGVAQKKAVS
ncbi:MAG: hypothetical protein COB09_16965 [Thalassobium sp.]|nr:MAG: hypothetical protein COB09_16965 [Thalassobium sp.]